jgi:hypothetical protein
MLYEIDIAEFGGDLERVRNVTAYLKDLGVNAIEIMPLSNVGSSVDATIACQIMGRPDGRRLCQPRLRDLPARQGEDRAGAILLEAL